MKRQIVVVLMSLMFINGCIWRGYNGGIKPSYPEVGYFKQHTSVDSLTPTFRWQSDTKASSTYDFAIWDEEGGRFEVRPNIYYKEALPQPEHKIETPLAPNTQYIWSVRVRSGDKTSEWATYNYHFFAVVIFWVDDNLPYWFKTPEIDVKKDPGVDIKKGQVQQ